MTSLRPALALLALLGAALLPVDTLLAQSLRGSTASVNRMFEHATDNGIYFYKTGAGIQKAAREGRFVRLASNASYRIHNASYPYVREETRTFVERLSAQYRSACGERLVITSGARPKSMRLTNGARKSVHPTGMAIDLRKPTRRSCLDWLRQTLIALEARGVIEATEEFNPPHFHVAVFPAPYVRYVKGIKGGTYASSASSSKYRVRRGDSLWAIARRHDTTVERLKAANGLRSSTVKIGQTLTIPD